MARPRNGLLTFFASSRAVFFVLLLLLCSAGTSVRAEACCGDTLVDADEAHRRSLREGRDPVEGLWRIRLDYNPEPDMPDTYRMAIVRNDDEGVYPEAEYVGVVICAEKACKRGEVKLLLAATGRRNEFSAVMLTSRGFGRGVAKLTKDAGDRNHAALDMRNVKIGDRIMAQWILREIDG